MSRCGGQCGTSVVELLASILLLSILSAMSYSFARAALLSARAQEAQTEVQEVAVLGIDILSRELRMAGFSAAGQPLVGVRHAEAERVEVVMDLNGDGDTADSNEIVTYSYDAERHALMRATAGGSPQPFARNVPVGGVRFAYFDAAGGEIAASDEMPLQDRRRIRRIDVTVRLQHDNPEAGVSVPVRATLTSTVALRNYEEPANG